MSSLAIWTTGLVAAACLFVACRGTAGASGNDLQTEVVMSGGTSGVLEQGVVIARDGDEWNALWAQHSNRQIPTPDAPAIDFDTSMIVAVFLGERPSGGYGIELDSCRVEEGHVVVRAHETTPDPEKAQTMAMTSPFVIAAVPVTAGAARLELE